MTEYKLVPCTRGPVPELRPLYDLSKSHSMAKQIVDKVQELLRLHNDWFYFNGLARPADLHDGRQPLFYVQMWDRRGLYRSIAFRGIGFVGVLNVEVRPNNQNKRRFSDYIGAAFFGVDQTTLEMGRDSASFCLGLVEGDTLHLKIPWRP